MYFPWPGFLEQIALCDTFVNYTDVQYSRGSFSNRVQIKTQKGVRWLTVPLRNKHLGQRIDEVHIEMNKDWRRSQRDQLLQAYSDAPYLSEMLDIIDAVFSSSYDCLADIAVASTMALVEYFGLEHGRTFRGSTELGIAGSGTQRVFDICSLLGAATYLTGHGARNYLDHEHFEARGIDVRYMDYGLAEWPQRHGSHTPYVSALDLVANCGRAGARMLGGRATPWREFLQTKEDKA